MHAMHLFLRYRPACAGGRSPAVAAGWQLLPPRVVPCLCCSLLRRLPRACRSTHPAWRAACQDVLTTALSRTARPWPQYSYLRSTAQLGWRASAPAHAVAHLPRHVGQLLIKRPDSDAQVNDPQLPAQSNVRRQRQRGPGYTGGKCARGAAASACGDERAGGGR